MKLHELDNLLVIDIEESLHERFMDSEELYVRFLRKLAGSTHFADMEAALAADDYDSLLRHAHNLKGVCANLGLTQLAEESGALVQALRAGCHEQSKLQARLEAVRALWQSTLAAIGELE